MKCSKAGKYLWSYIDNELGAQDVALLESHLNHCEQCTGQLEQIRRLRGMFNQAQRFSAPSALKARIMEKVNESPAKGFSLFPIFIRFAEVGVFVLTISAGIMSGGMLISSFALHHRGEAIISSLSLDTFEALPPDSLGRAYLAMTEERR
jgi:mycothiol system anti-sigma-R factor